jgi:hypothetical protein
MTATAGTIAWALSIGAQAAVLIVHEFTTMKTTDSSRLKRARNARDLDAFVKRLSLGTLRGLVSGQLSGPLGLPGRPLFEPGALPPLYIGKISTLGNTWTVGESVD